MSRNLSTAEVSRILALEESRIRELVRSGGCWPRRRGHRYAFDFQDLVVLRAARDLLAVGVPLARLRRALATLAAKLPEGEPLSGLRIWADGRRVGVCDPRGSWNPETGQMVFDFETDDLARAVRDLREAPAETVCEAERGASEWFERGLDLDDVDPKAAADAYARALALDPELVDAYVNAGRIAHESGDALEAIRLYGCALERTPDDPVVHFNLALAVEDARGCEAAVAHYERSLELDPDFADAHFNLAALCERLGRQREALRHYLAYRRLSAD